MRLPEEFLNRMKTLLPDYDEFVNSYNLSPVKSFFINKNKISEGEFLNTCDWKIEKCAEGYKLLDDVKVGRTPEHHSGMIYMQELSAMMPINFLPLNDNDWVVDLCSAPGGKSIQVANKIPNGVLLSNEIIKSRAGVLKSNIERMGLSNVCITNNEPKDLEKFFEGVFDAVVVDAPCSGEGMFRKDEDARLNWSQANVEACATRQVAILETADKLLRNGGYLLYSTCTFSIEEDEGVVASFCAKHNYEIVPLSYPGAEQGVKIENCNTNYCLRFYPHRFEGEGQFVALLRKNEKSNKFIAGKVFYKPLTKFPTEYKIFKNFCNDCMFEYNDILDSAIYNNGTIYYMANKQIAESGVNLVNCGVVLGEIVKNRFEPNHNFASCFGSRFKNVLDLDDVEVEKFLKGETIICDFNGYVLLTYRGVSLGFGKCVNGILKNHYPKGLRNL